MGADLSIVVVFYDMRRVAERTLFTLSSAYQRGVEPDQYRVIAIDNGSTHPLDPGFVESFGPNFTHRRFASGSRSPAAAVNFGVGEADTENVAVIVDGARMLSPGLVALTRHALALSDTAFVGSLAFLLDPPSGSGSEAEDRLLEQVDWRSNGYRLFEHARVAKSSAFGFLGGLPPELSFFAMRREEFVAIGGLDERFAEPGGGLVNHDFRERAVETGRFDFTMLLGEGSFHQEHGGVTTGGNDGAWKKRFAAEYLSLKGAALGKPAEVPVTYFGRMNDAAYQFVSRNPGKRLNTGRGESRAITPRHNRPLVTVLIPAFRAGSAIVETLKRVRLQSFTDYEVFVAIEPAGDEPAREQLTAYAADARFNFHRNDEILGWAGNVAALQERVQSAFFVILPHDDLWEEDYLASLVALLEGDAGATVAHADMQLIGAKEKVRSPDYARGSVANRLLSFYLQGGEGHIWRGVTRSSVLAGGRHFPVYDPLAFAAECEWVHHLLREGRSVRDPRPLYRKRTYPSKELRSMSSRWRLGWSPSDKRKAIAVHRERMLAAIPGDVADEERCAIRLACEVTMIRRLVTLGIAATGLTKEEEARIASVRDGAPHLDPDVGNSILGYLDRELEKVAAKKRRAAKPADRGSA